MLGQPDIAEPEPFGKTHLLDLLVDANGVLFRRRRRDRVSHPKRIDASVKIAET